MLSGRTFRAQLMTQGQRELYDYWCWTAGARSMPSRSDISPFSVPKLLPCIGLIDLTKGLPEATFRLAGTQLRDVYGEEITGKRIDRVFAGAVANYWHQVHVRVAEDGSPLNGAVHGPVQGRDHIVLLWMRLPLSQDGRHVDRILCYDTAAPIGAVQSAGERRSLRLPRLLAQVLPAGQRQAQCT
jgi:hypothetical protein